MKKLLCFLMLMGLMSLASAQVADYTFSQANNTYADITGGTVLGSATTNDEYFVDPTVPDGSTTVTSGVGLPIGFSLTFNGDNFDVFGVHANGWISLGQSSQTPSINMNTSSNLAPINATSTAPAVLQNRIVGLGRNLMAQAVSELRYETIGAAPNRALVVQWKNYKRTTGGAVDTLNFQIRLNETSNIVEIIYGKMKVSSSTNTIQLGLRGQSNADFNNRTTTTDWTTTTAGVANNSSMTISTTVYPPSGLTFIWTPPLADDAGVISINSPASIVFAGLQKVAVTLENFGTDTLKNATIKWSINGTPLINHLWSDTLLSGATSSPDTIGTYNFISGTYIIKSWTENPNGSADLNNTNDTAVKTVIVQAFSSLPFNEGFDSTWIDKLDTHDAPSVYWANTPATSDSSWRRNDDGTSAAWTNSSGNYTPAGANSTIHSARFHTWDAVLGTSGTMDAYMNFSTAGTKILKFWYINPTGVDSLSVFLSTDGGANYTFLQQYLTSASWTEYTLSLGTSATATTVLRFKATSDYGNDDIGIDGVQVYLQPANDIAAVEWVAPLGGCGMTATETVTIKLTNTGTNTQSNIPVRYSINGGTTIVGPEFVAGPINPGDTISYSFTATADFSAPGIYHCIFQASLSGDQYHPNDTTSAFITSSGTINTFPFTENFNNPAGTPYFSISVEANAAANLLDTNGVGNTGCAFFTGFSSNAGWSGTGTIPAAAAYGTYTTHHSALTPTCNIDATGLPNLRMDFDLKQEYYTQRTYTWLVLIANGTDTLTDIDGIKYYNPTTTTADPFTTRTFDLSAYAGTIFTVEFKSACKYNPAFGAPGNNNYIDNIYLYVQAEEDAGVTSVISPISSACGNTNDSLIVMVYNYGLNTLTNIPVIGDITAPSGGHLILTDTLAGPLAPNTSDTLVVGYGNTLGSGTYNVSVYTDLAADTVFTNDTAHYAFTKYPPLPLPHLEDFESTTPLALWSTDFTTSNGHGNTSYVMYRNLSTTNTTGTATMTKRVGAIHANSYLSFLYRIVNFTGGGATTLGTDSVFILLSDDCETTFDTVYTINQSTHISSTSMKRIVVPIGAYNTSRLIFKIYAKRGTTGNYYLDFDEIAFSDAPNVNLGPDTAFCPGGNITLSAGGAPLGYTYIYNWSTIDHPASIATTQTINVDSAATYIATVDNGYGVIDSDTMIVDYYLAPNVSIGNDTSNCAAYTLDAGTGHTSYNWSTGETTQEITVTSSGTYWVDVSNNAGCISRDSAVIIIIPLPTADAGPTQTICFTDTLQIISATAADYDSLLWTSSGDGHFNDSTLLNTYYVPGTTDIANGTVDLTLTAYANCDTVSSLVVVTITTSAIAYAGADEEICIGAIVQLSATGGTTYVWSPATGLSNANISNPVASPTSTTNYTVTVTSSCGTATDDVIVTVDMIAVVNLGVDQTVCADATVILDAGAGYDSYNWSTGDNTQTISVDTNGIGTGTFVYWVDVSKGVCSVSDTVSVTFDLCVDVTDYSGNAGVSVYPNPTTGLTSIVINGFTNAVLNIYNVQGATVYTENINGNNASAIRLLDLSALNKGIYLIRISDEKNNVSGRLIIQ